jgi:NNP family nitrate/nitrite transporter-like MFS transporter
MKSRDLFKIQNPEMRALHLTWIAFFICFFTWFNMAPLATTMAKELGWLTQKDLGLLAICNVALTIPVRVFVGMAMDRWGPRRVFSVLMVTMSVPVFVFALGNNFAQLMISRLLLGCIGAGFVVGVHMTSLWFKPKDVGFAVGIYAGWGNTGAAAAAMTLPTLVFHFFGGEGGWRYAIAANGMVLLLYGIFYGWAMTDGPKGSVHRKPRKVAAIEVSSTSDMIQLAFLTVPVIGALAILIWKVQKMGYIGEGIANLAYLLIAGGALYQVVQVFKINLPILKKGVPQDDRYPFSNVVALNVTYFANFGAILAVDSMLPAFFETTYDLSPAFAGLIASSFAFVNIVARPLGGALSDRMKSRKGVIMASMLGTAISFLLMSFINANWPIALAVLVTMCCAFFIQGAAGATFAVIPMVKRRLTGQISGMIGAYGNIGALVYITIYTFVGAKPLLFIIACGALVSFLVCLFFLGEPKAERSGEYRLSSVDIDIEGDAYLSNLNLAPEVVEEDDHAERIQMKVHFDG